MEEITENLITAIELQNNLIKKLQKDITELKSQIVNLTNVVEFIRKTY